MEKSGKNIFLTGFVGSGKSTIGKYLAKKLAKTYVDIDEIIQSQYGLTISEIFKKYGEEFFREKESEILKIVSQKKNQIVSLGGGTLIRFENLKQIKDQGTVVYLRASLTTVLKRLSENYQNRPLIKENKLEELLKLFQEREPGYKTADVSVDTENMSISEISGEILKGIEKCQKYSQN